MNIKPSGAGVEIFCQNLVNTKAADALAPSVARPSAGMVLTLTASSLCGMVGVEVVVEVVVVGGGGGGGGCGGLEGGGGEFWKLWCYRAWVEHVSLVEIELFSLIQPLVTLFNQLLMS